MCTCLSLSLSLSLQRPRATPSLSPTAAPVFALGEAATPGKSNLKQNSQFSKKKATSPIEPTPGASILPEIPTIEVLSATSGDEDEGSKVGKTSAKEVRFADQVSGATETERSPSSGQAVVTTGEKTADEEGEKIEMESVDFDKATGTSTPITEDSPSLAKRGLTPESQNLSNGVDESSSTAEEREEVLVAAAAEGERDSRERDNIAMTPSLDERGLAGVPEQTAVPALTAVAEDRS